MLKSISTMNSHYRSSNKKYAGFTVVELVIAISVIAILASVTVVAYKGITARSKNTQTATLIQRYIDTLVIYHAKYGKYPVGNSNNKTCLGIGYPSGKCWKGEIDESATFMQELKKVGGDGFPMTANQSLGLRGAWFVTAADGLTPKLDGVKEDFVVYSVEGDKTKCQVGPIASDGTGGNNNDGNIFTYFSTPPASGQSVLKGQNASDEPAQCWVPMSLVK